MKDSKMMIRLSENDKRIIRDLAEAKDETMSFIVREAIREYIQKHYSDKK